MRDVKVSAEYQEASREFIENVASLMSSGRAITEADVDELRKAYYELPDNIAGGSLHIVLDDYNWERRHVEWTRNVAFERDDAAGVCFVDLLLTLTDDQLRAWIGPSWCGRCGADYGDEHKHFHPPFDTEGGRCPACGAYPEGSSR